MAVVAAISLGLATTATAAQAATQTPASLFGPLYREPMPQSQVADMLAADAEAFLKDLDDQKAKAAVPSAGSRGKLLDIIKKGTKVVPRLTPLGIGGSALVLLADDWLLSKVKNGGDPEAATGHTFSQCAVDSTGTGCGYNSSTGLAPAALRSKFWWQSSHAGYALSLWRGRGDLPINCTSAGAAQTNPMPTWEWYDAVTKTVTAKCMGNEANGTAYARSRLLKAVEQPTMIDTLHPPGTPGLGSPTHTTTDPTQGAFPAEGATVEQGSDWSKAVAEQLQLDENEDVEAALGAYLKDQADEDAEIEVPPFTPGMTIGAYTAVLEGVGLVAAPKALTDATADPDRSPGEVIAATPTPGTKVAPSTTVTVTHNPTIMGGASGVTPEGCGGTIPPVDLTPLSAIPVGQVFPFGVFPWLGEAFGEWVGGGSAPRFTLPVGQVGNVDVDFAVMQPVVNILRPIALATSIIGFVWLLSSAALGGGAGGKGDD